MAAVQSGLGVGVEVIHTHHHVCSGGYCPRRHVCLHLHINYVIRL